MKITSYCDMPAGLHRGTWLGTDILGIIHGFEIVGYDTVPIPYNCLEGTVRVKDLLECELVFTFGPVIEHELTVIAPGEMVRLRKVSVRVVNRKLT